MKNDADTLNRCSVWTETTRIGEGADEEQALLAALAKRIPEEDRPTSP